MPKDLELQRDTDFLELPPERDESEIARTTSILQNIHKSYMQRSSEIRGGSVSGKYPENDTEQLESFADRLISDNVAKQAMPDTVELTRRRFASALAKAQSFDQAFVPKRWASDLPRTVFGTEAWVGIRYFPKTFRQGYLPRFVSKTLALPCVERTVRKEVMFAKRKAGRGYRKPHRRGHFSDIWC